MKKRGMTLNELVACVCFTMGLMVFLTIIILVTTDGHKKRVNHDMSQYRLPGVEKKLEEDHAK